MFTNFLIIFSLLLPGFTNSSFEDVIRLANEGNPSAQCELAFRYLEGKDVPCNKVSGAKWLRRAAEQGNHRAQLRLAMLYQKGEGVIQDMKEAEKWYLKAIEHGSSQAEFNLGLLYYHGDGIEQDRRKGLSLLETAATKDYVNAQYNLGVICLSSEDFSKAHYWFHRAALQNDPSSQYNLATLYFSGLGVMQNRAEAYKWLLIAARNKNPEARNLLDQYPSPFTLEEVLEGEKLFNKSKTNLR